MKVYLDENTPPATLLYDGNETYFEFMNVEQNKEYFWKVVPYNEIDSLLNICDGLRYSNPDSAMTSCRSALESAMKEDYDAGIIRAHLLMGIIHDVSSKYDSALFHYRTSLAHSHKVGDTLRVLIVNTEHFLCNDFR